MRRDPFCAITVLIGGTCAPREVAKRPPRKTAHMHDPLNPRTPKPNDRNFSNPKASIPPIGCEKQAIKFIYPNAPIAISRFVVKSRLQQMHSGLSTLRMQGAQRNTARFPRYRFLILGRILVKGGDFRACLEVFYAIGDFFNIQHMYFFGGAGIPIHVEAQRLLVTGSIFTLTPSRQFVIIDTDATAEVPATKPPLSKCFAQVEQNANGYAETLNSVCRTLSGNPNAYTRISSSDKDPSEQYLTLAPENICLRALGIALSGQNIQP